MAVDVALSRPHLPQFYVGCWPYVDWFLVAGGEVKVVSDWRGGRSSNGFKKEFRQSNSFRGAVYVQGVLQKYWCREDDAMIQMI